MATRTTRAKATTAQDTTKEKTTKAVKQTGGSAAKATAFEDTRASDNFVNLFEMPVLFYVAAFVAILADAVTPLALALAWSFAGLRAVHSLIQCSYNRVMHRFAVYSLSSLVLAALWVHLALRVLA